MKVLAKNIRTLRHQYNWSQEDVARRLGISIPAFSKIETGITDVNLSRIEQIANIFGVSPVKLLADEEELNEEPQQQLLDEVRQKLLEREEEIHALQKKVIVLYEELRNIQSVHA